jgi:hypothetical protein
MGDYIYMCSSNNLGDTGGTGNSGGSGSTGNSGGSSNEPPKKTTIDFVLNQEGEHGSEPTSKEEKPKEEKGPFRNNPQMQKLPENYKGVPIRTADKEDPFVAYDPESASYPGKKN